MFSEPILSESVLVLNFSNLKFTDGNIKFDELVANKNLFMISRFISGNYWIKYYNLSDKIDMINKTGIDYVEDSIYLKYSLQIKGSKRMRTYKSLLNFKTSTIETKYYNSDGYSIEELSKINIDMFNISEKSYNVKLKNMKILLKVKDIKIRKDILFDFLTNVCDSKKISIYEKIIPVSLKYSPSFSFMNCFISFDEINNMFVINDIKDQTIIQNIIDELIKLLTPYFIEKDNIIKVYERIFKEDYSDIYIDKENSEVKKLRDEVPELFVSGYSRECSNKPFIVTREQAINIEKEGRKTIVYPKDGPYSRIYAAPKGMYVGLKKNRLINKDIFEYLPICYTTDHFIKQGSNLNKYYYDMRINSENTVNKIYTKSSTITRSGGFGKIPVVLNKLIQDKDSVKLGVPRNKSSILHCLLRISDEKEIIRYRKNISINPVICSQELYYLEEYEIIRDLKDPEIFLDPVLFIRALEELFNINLYIFNIYDKSRVDLAFPNKVDTYIWEHDSTRESKIILCYRDIPDYPQCELVISKWNNNIRMYKEKILEDISQIIEKPKPGFTKQKLDDKGKCISVYYDNIWKSCYYRPVNVISEKQINNSSEIINFSNKRIKIYTLFDLFNILRSYAEENIYSYINFIKDDIDFSPFIIREKFSNVEEFLTYNKNLYPTLFKDNKYNIKKELFLLFLDSNITNRLSYELLSQENFTRHKDNIIIIEKNISN